MIVLEAIATRHIEDAMTGASVEAPGRAVEATHRHESTFIARLDLVARGR